MWDVSLINIVEQLRQELQKDFLLMIFLYKNYGKKLHRGFFFGLCLTEIFVFRFFVEFLKENQVDFENSMSLNMGQWLSVPFVIIGVYFMFFYGKKKTQK